MKVSQRHSVAADGSEQNTEAQYEAQESGITKLLIRHYEAQKASFPITQPIIILALSLFVAIRRRSRHHSRKFPLHPLIHPQSSRGTS